MQIVGRKDVNCFSSMYKQRNFLAGHESRERERGNMLAREQEEESGREACVKGRESESEQEREREKEREMKH